MFEFSEYDISFCSKSPLNSQISTDSFKEELITGKVTFHIQNLKPTNTSKYTCIFLKSIQQSIKRGNQQRPKPFPFKSQLYKGTRQKII